jgi:5-methylcytosine-specific restriction enzyme subunit McrC
MFGRATSSLSFGRVSVRTEYITESKETLIELKPDEVEALRRLGASLASKSRWFGSSEEEETADRTVIKCTRTDKEGVYSVKVADAVGVIGVLDRLQIEVRPKIPLSHLIHLMTAADELPRMDEQAAEVEYGQNLLELIARWYVKAAERLLRRGLIKDYSARRDFLSAKRGRLDTLRTARAFYSGRIGFECEFDEFGMDTALNRAVREGASVVVRNRSLGDELRREALRIRNRMDGVGQIQFGDLRADVDRRAGHYQPALPLAKQLIRAEGRTLRGGARDTWSFLIKTPDIVEDGLRSILREGLAPTWTVKPKQGFMLAKGAQVSFNPDLEFDGGAAVGDVKYKLQGAEWNRNDLNQIVTFVAAYDCGHGAVFSFRGKERDPLPNLVVGTQHICSITWPVADGATPEAAAERVVADAAEWLLGTRPQVEAVA